MKSLVPLLLLAATAFGQPTAVLTGTITDSVTRLPLHRVLISAPNGSRDVTGVDGRFTLHELPAGEIKLRLAMQGYRALETSVNMDGERLSSYFEIHPMARISGQVTDKVSGKPLARMVMLTRPDRQVVNFSATGSDGKFEFIGLESGDYALEIDPVDEAEISFNPPADTKRPDSYGLASLPDIIHLIEGEKKTIDMRLSLVEPHSVTGSVEFPSGIEETPLSVGYIYMEAGMAMMRNLGTHREGIFRIDGLTRPGQYQITAQSGSGGKKLSASAAISLSDRDISGVILKLVPGVEVRGSIEMAEQDTVFPPKAPGLSVILEQSERRMFSLNDPMRVETGHFHGEGLMRGNYWPQLIGLPEGYAITKIMLGNADTGGRPIALYGPAELTFIATSKPGAIAGNVRDRNQAPVKDAKILLIPQFTGDPQRAVNTVSGFSGEFQFRNLAPGIYTIEGTPPIEIKPGQTAAVTVTR